VIIHVLLNLFEKASASKSIQITYVLLCSYSGIIDPYKRHEMSAQDSQVNLANWKLK
jgi:hypothetical protein